MKKFYKMLGLGAIMLFSFYYTEKIAILMQNKSPLMQSINEVADDYTVAASNAVIDGAYIIPGINGKMINKTKSYVNMKSFGAFEEYYLIFDEVKPAISLQDNKDKIINQGNANKRAVALLLEENPQIKNYLQENKINASLLVTESNYEKDNFFEQINNETKKYNNIESLLNKNNINKNICYVKTLDQEFCIKNKKYLIEESFTLMNSNIIEAKKKIKSGAIILIKDSVGLDTLKLLLKEIQFKGLNIIPVSELINENS